MNNNYLIHHGVKGMKWGVRNRDRWDPSGKAREKELKDKVFEKSLYKYNYNWKTARGPRYEQKRKEYQDAQKEYTKYIEERGKRATNNVLKVAGVYTLATIGAGVAAGLIKKRL